MNDYIVLTISIFACLLCGVISKYLVKNFNSKHLSLLLNCGGSIGAIITFLIWGGFTKISLFSALLAIAFGTCIVLTIVFQVEAIKIGSWAYTTVLISLSTLIPSASGWIVWNEPVKWNQIIGIVLIVICFILSVDFRTESDAKMSKKWLGFVGISFVCNGAIGLLQKIHQKSAYKAESGEFLIIAFCMIFLITSLALFISIRKGKSSITLQNETEEKVESEVAVALQSEGEAKKKWELFTKASLLCFGLIFVRGIFEAINHKLNLHLAGVMESAVMFPILNGSNLILTAIFGVLLFKEKQTKRQWLGIAIGVAAVLLLCI